MKNNEIKIITPIELMVEHHKAVWLRLCEKQGIDHEEAEHVWKDEMEAATRFLCSKTDAQEDIARG